MNMTGVERGCGTREPGGIYLECGMSEAGMPVEYFMVDPMPQVPHSFLVPPIGHTPMEIDGVWHLLDRVGTENYPTPRAFVEEARYYGISRRVSRKFDFERLTKGSHLMLLHSKARIVDAQKFIMAALGTDGEALAATYSMARSPKASKHLDGLKSRGFHYDPPIRLLDSCIPLDPAMFTHEPNWAACDLAESLENPGNRRLMLPDREHVYWMVPYVGDREYEVEYELGIFAVFPITGIAVVDHDRDKDLVTENLSLARASGLPVYVEPA